MSGEKYMQFSKPTLYTLKLLTEEIAIFGLARNIFFILQGDMLQGRLRHTNWKMITLIRVRIIDPLWGESVDHQLISLSKD